MHNICMDDEGAEIGGNLLGAISEVLEAEIKSLESKRETLKSDLADVEAGLQKLNSQVETLQAGNPNLKDLLSLPPHAQAIIGTHFGRGARKPDAPQDDDRSLRILIIEILSKERMQFKDLVAEIRKTKPNVVDASVSSALVRGQQQTPKVFDKKGKFWEIVKSKGL